MTILFGRHIELPVHSFYVKFLHKAYVNVLKHKQYTEVVEIRAETPKGALDIVEYHFGRSIVHGTEFQLILEKESKL